MMKNETSDEIRRIAFVLTTKSTEELIRLLDQPRSFILDLIQEELRSRPDFLPVGTNEERNDA